MSLDPNNIDDLQSIEKSRSIVNEILRFGVREQEIKKIISLLSLELEDTDCMRNIQESLKSKTQNSVKEEKLLLQ